MGTAPKKLLAVGATGSIGEHVVAVALAEGYEVRVLVRNARQASQFPAGVEVAVGDLTRAETLTEAVAGIDSVVFTHGSNGMPPGPEAVDYGAVRNVLTALGHNKVRIALMTTIGSTDRKGAHDWKRRGERLVRASGHPYTIVRPSWFDYNAPDQHRLVMLQGDTRLTGTPRDGQIARRQLAEVLVRSLRSNAALRKTFELNSETGPAQKDFDPLFAALDADTPGAIDGAHDKANMPLDKEPLKMQQELQAVQARANAAS
ncbi:MAG: hypothetical protein RLZZ371_46 [Pseudomonadota bacterium]|jgi:uncharacterized protein YbjT (DUF2867 family)